MTTDDYTNYIVITLGLLVFTGVLVYVLWWKKQTFVSNEMKKVPLGYASTEHRNMGDMTILYTPEDTKVLGQNYHFEVGGNKINFGYLIAYPDYFGNPDIIISNGKDETERRIFFSRTLDAARNTDATETSELLNLMDYEKAQIENRYQRTKSWEKAFAEITEEIDRKANVITGGGSFISDYFPMGRYLKIAANNLDHFAPQAMDAFKAGWQYATNMAVNRDLNSAYIAIGFACHFLTDAFTAGHLRTPRKALHEYCYPSEVGGLLGKENHDFDNLHGVIVRNKRGDQWITYGDGAYFEPKNAENRERIRKAMQQAVDDVYSAFKNQAIPTYIFDEIVPNYEELYNNPNIYGNITPMIAYRNGKFYNRYPWSSATSNTPMAEWSNCWATYLDLKMNYKLNELQSFLNTVQGGIEQEASVLSSIMTPEELAMITKKDIKILEYELTKRLNDGSF